MYLWLLQNMHKGVLENDTSILQKHRKGRVVIRFVLLCFMGCAVHAQRC